MFRSRPRGLVFPQFEHLRLAGTLALLYGNAEFEAPPVDRPAFVSGVALHDWGYGVLDNYPIGDIPDEDWLQITRKSFSAAPSDPVAGLITRFHLRRLVGSRQTPERQALLQEMDRAIDDQLAAHGLPRGMFERIDRITHFCDKIAFDFCMAAASEGTAEVFPANASDRRKLLTYHIKDGRIMVSPWPFSVAADQGYLQGYTLQGYPDKLEPHVVPFLLTREA